MIKSKLSFRFAYGLLAIFIIIDIIVFGFCTMTDHFDPNDPFYFNWDAFLTVNLILVFLFGINFISSFSKMNKITIDGNRVRIQKHFSIDFIEYSLSDISGFYWRHTHRSVGRGPGGKTTQKIATIIFTDGTELEIDNLTYVNFAELRNFFYSYCEKQGLLKETTGQKRKRMRLFGR